MPLGRATRCLKYVFSINTLLTNLSGLVGLPRGLFFLALTSRRSVLKFWQQQKFCEGGKL